MFRTLVILFWVLAEFGFSVNDSFSFPIKNDSTFVPGHVVKKVISGNDPQQQYSVFIPSSYSSNKKWPIVFIMDPRGRALQALNLFRAAAEKLGYILMSSYNTMSDGPEQPNVDALNTMIHDAAGKFSVNAKRLYLAGFSGTARIAWPYGYQLKNNVAGIIGFGAGTTNDILLPVAVKKEGMAFSYFGGAAYYDFNYFEVFNLDNKLSDLHFPHGVEFYEGVHGWPSENIISDALYWMELRAMKEHKREVDPEIVDLYMKKQLSAGKKLEEAGNNYEAYRRYQIALEASDGLVDNPVLRKQVRRLKKNLKIKQVNKALKEQSERTSGYLGEMAGYFFKIRKSEKVPSPEEIRHNLYILNLMLDAKAEHQNYKTRASRVMLENAYVRLSYYEPRYFLESNKPKWALVMLKVAQQIKPNAPQNCLFLARTYAELNKNAKAFKALQCLDELHILNRDMLETDPYLQALNTDPRMEHLKEHFKAAEE